MIKILTYFSGLITFILFIFTINSFFYTPKKLVKSDENQEMFDIELSHLNTLIKVDTYLDHIAKKTSIMNSESEIIDTASYVLLVDDFLKKRFHHRYSHYNLSNNYIAAMLGYFRFDMSAVVIPEDLLKYENAACSQQAILFQEILKRKGINVRTVGFESSFSGHFCSEVEYDNSYHFFDTDLEADWSTFDEIPSTEELVNNKDMLKRAYAHHLDRLIVFTENDPIYQEWNEFPAKNARLFHKVTKFISNYGFLVMGLISFLLVRKMNDPEAEPSRYQNKLN